MVIAEITLLLLTIPHGLAYAGQCRSRHSIWMTLSCTIMSKTADPLGDYPVIYR